MADRQTDRQTQVTTMCQLNYAFHTNTTGVMSGTTFPM